MSREGVRLETPGAGDPCFEKFRREGLLELAERVNAGEQLSREELTRLWEGGCGCDWWLDRGEAFAYQEECPMEILKQLCVPAHEGCEIDVDTLKAIVGHRNMNGEFLKAVLETTYNGDDACLYALWDEIEKHFVEVIPVIRERLGPEEADRALNYLNE